jgi:hypothetical protein
MNTVLRIVHAGKRWLLMEHKNHKPISVHDYKSEAIASGIELCKSMKMNLYVHSKKGVVTSIHRFKE